MAEKNEVKKEKKPGLFARLKVKLKGLKSEFKKITWAPKKATFKSFGLVLICVVAIAMVLGLVDAGLSALFDALGTLF
jgi:preprotein translocase SecE subunit